MNVSWGTVDVLSNVSMTKDPFIVLVHKDTSWVLMASHATVSMQLYSFKRNSYSFYDTYLSIHGCHY